MPNLSPISSQIRVVDKFSKAFAKMNTGLGRVNAATTRLRNGFHRLNQEANVGKRWKNLKTQTGTLAKRLTFIGGAATAAAGGLYAMVNATAVAGDRIAKVSSQLGLSTDAYQELMFAADRSGVSQGVFNSSIGAFTKRLGEARVGTGGLTTFLKKFSPSLLKQMQATKTAEEGLMLLFSAMDKIEDPTMRAALASAAFSRAGIGMVNLTKNGTKEIEKLREQYRVLGGTISEDAAKASEDFIDAQTDMKLALTGVRNIIGGQLMPQVTALTRRFTEFVVQNRSKISEFSKNFARELPGRLSKLLDVSMALGRGFLALARVVDRTANAVGGYENLVKIVIALMAVKWVLAVGQMTSSLVQLGTKGIPMAVTGLKSMAPLLSNVGGMVAGLAGKIGGLTSAAGGLGALAGQGAMVAAAGAAGYGVGTLANKGLGAAADKLSGGKYKGDGWFGDWLYDQIHGADEKLQKQEFERNMQDMKARNDLIRQMVKQGLSRSEIKIRLENMPKGTRVSSDGDAVTDLSMGYAMATP